MALLTTADLPGALVHPDIAAEVAATTAAAAAAVTRDVDVPEPSGA